MTTAHIWNFSRAGGFDQVQFDSGADLLALKELDQKLWVALGCPTRGIEFDIGAPDLINGDGHMRRGAGGHRLGRGLLRDADLLVRGSDSLMLADVGFFGYR